MSSPIQTEPRRPGRPPKDFQARNPQFPGTVIKITSKPRLRPGVICEIRASRFPQNIGVRVEIVEFRNNGMIEVRAIDRALQTWNEDTKLVDGEFWISCVRPEQLYRIGHR